MNKIKKHDLAIFDDNYSRITSVNRLTLSKAMEDCNKILYIKELLKQQIKSIEKDLDNGYIVGLSLPYIHRIIRNRKEWKEFLFALFPLLLDYQFNANGMI